MLALNCETRHRYAHATIRAQLYYFAVRAMHVIGGWDTQLQARAIAPPQQWTSLPSLARERMHACMHAPSNRIRPRVYSTHAHHRSVECVRGTCHVAASTRTMPSNVCAFHANTFDSKGIYLITCRHLGTVRFCVKPS